MKLRFYYNGIRTTEKKAKEILGEKEFNLLMLDFEFAGQVGDYVETMEGVKIEMVK